jgi:hypothetical protein
MACLVNNSPSYGLRSPRSPLGHNQTETTRRLTMHHALRTLTLTATALAVAGGTLTTVATTASAAQFAGTTLAPGSSTCVSQFAAYQVRGDGSATADGARFKLIFRGAVLDATSGRTPRSSVERRTAYGTFPGADYYTYCAYNTGTRATTVQLTLRTDAEF